MTSTQAPPQGRAASRAGTAASGGAPKGIFSRVENMHTDWDPAVVQFKGLLQQAADEAKAALKIIEGELPTHKIVHAAFGKIAQAIARIPGMVDAANSVFKKAHQADRARSERPRTNEHKWDVGKGR